MKPRSLATRNEYQLKEKKSNENKKCDRKQRNHAKRAFGF